MNRRRWILPLIAATMAGLVAYGIAWHFACRSVSCVNQLQDIAFLTRELRLSDTQAKQIRALHITLGMKLNDCCARHCAAQSRLAEALTDDTNGTGQAEAILAEMCRAYEESERATFEGIRQVQAVLNAEQRKRFDALLAQCMCRTCSMPGNKVRSNLPPHD